MKYYEMHESVYQKLLEQGHVSWDKHPDVQSLLTTSMNLPLLDFLPSLKDLSTLDLGTGSGVCALFCGYHGAKATGVDLSATAILMARSNAAALKLEVDFQTADILSLDLKQKFHLVTDSSLLHCLIGEDRNRFYKTVKTHLAPGGYLYIHTMIEAPDMSSMINPQYFHFEYPIFWSLGIDSITSGRKVINGKSYFPHRTILSQTDLLSELASHDFKVLSQKTHEFPKGPTTLVLLTQWTPDS